MLGHRLDAVDPGAQVDPVQVQLEDLRFRELRFDEQRNRGLLDLSAVGPRVREKERASQLLRDGAAAFGTAAAAQIARERTQDADRVDTWVVEKPAIFN